MRISVFILSLITWTDIYAQDPGLLWARGVGGAGMDQGVSTTVDANGNMYTTGYFHGTADFDPGAGVFNLIANGENDVFILKLDASGNFIWAKQIGGSGKDEGRSVSIDANGNILITGNFFGIADLDPGANDNTLDYANGNIFILKLDPDGNFIWAKQFGNPVTSVLSMKLDAAGNIYTTGGFQLTADFDTGPGIYDLITAGNNAEIFISKLDPSGNFIWARQIGTVNGGGGVAYSIDVDNNGNVYTTGSFRHADFDPGPGTYILGNQLSLGEVFVSKLNSNGNFVWAKSWGGTISYCIDVDVNGYVYTTGIFGGTVDFDPGPAMNNISSSGNNDAFVSKLDTDGNFVWAKKIGGAVNNEAGRSILVDGIGNVYTTGYFNDIVDFDPGPGIYNLSSFGNHDIFISKLDVNGNFVWAINMGGTTQDEANSIALDASKNIYLTGFFGNTADFDPGTGTYNLTASGDYDIYVVKLRQGVCTGVNISTQPVDQTATVGSTATFNVVAIGTSPYIYQWKKNGVDIIGANSDSYTTPILTLAGSGDYYSCFITNCNGLYAAISNEALLTVNSTCSTPTTQAASINFSSVSSSQMTISWTNGNGSGRILVAKANSSINDAPSNGTSYTGNPGFGSGSTISSGEYVVYSGSGTGPVTVTNLSPGTTYYFRLYEYSCTPTQYLNATATGNPNSHATTLITSPSQIMINNVIPNNSTFPTPKQLWSGYTNQVTPAIKICADASKATEITFINNTGVNSNNIRFWIASDPNGNNSDISGYFILTDYSVNGNTVKAKFSHPKFLQSTYMPFRSDAIQIVDYTDPSSILFTIPVDIYRAPVIMVHGLWGDSRAFDEMKTDLDNSDLYIKSLTKKVDYRHTNSWSFLSNFNVIPDNINSILLTARADGFSAGKVDMVCHSMGGILARQYIQSPSFQLKKDVHKLITINTPHSGSQAANLLLNLTTCEGVAANAAVAYWLFVSYPGATVWDGAVSDLKVNSQAIQSLNGTGLNAGIVPSHAIITEYDPSFFVDLASSFLSAYIASSLPCGVNTAGGFLNHLFYNEPNDLIVSIPSQTGGLTSQYITRFFDQAHVGSAKDPLVIANVRNLLTINPANSNIFSQTGFSPADLSNNTHYRVTGDSASYRVQEGSMNILSPNSGQGLNPGDTIHVSFNSNNGITRTILQAFASGSSTIFIKDTMLSAGIIDYLIPMDAFGKIGIILIGYNASGTFIDYDTVLLNVNVISTLDSITCPVDTIYIQADRTTGINLTGYFHNGYVQEISTASGILYQVADNTIARSYYSNLVRGLKIGTTILSATYLGQIKNIPVVVTPQDTTNPEINLSPTIIAAGPTTFCQGGSVALTASPGISYLWSSGEMTRSIIVNSSGSYSVTVRNLNDYSATSTAINVQVIPLPGQPGTISGNTTICQGSMQNFSISTVPNATSYLWSLPSGWTGSSTTNTIQVTAGSNSDTIRVNAINSCGTSIEQKFAITLNPLPGQPGIITGNNNVVIAQILNYSVNPITNATGYNWQLSGGGTITSGQNTPNVTINWTTAGHYTLSVNGINSCGSGPVQTQNDTVSVGTGIVNPDNQYQLKILPNPTSGEFYLVGKGMINKTIKVEIFDALGHNIQKIEQKVSTNDYYRLIDLQKMADGIYFIRIYIERKNYLRSVIKQD